MIPLPRVRATLAAYPPQFWLLFGGVLLLASSVSLVGPYLLLYMSERLKLPLSVMATALMASAAAELVSTFVAGPVVDRLGRRAGMLFGLFAVSGVYLGLARAQTFGAFTLLVMAQGFAVPFYRIGMDAMVADLIPEARRAPGFALLRMSDNLGFAVGPILGGVLASLSNTFAFNVAAAGLAGYGLLTMLGARETLAHAPDTPRPGNRAAYRKIFADRRFLAVNLSFLGFQVCATILWQLLALYTKTHYAVPTLMYGWIPATNAAMVVLFQVGVTRVSRRFLPLRVMTLGALIYALGVGSVALGSRFEHFWLSFVVVTVGELLLVPTASAYVAGLAPADMRGRYLSLFSLTQGGGRGLAPALGGQLNDQLGPQAIWQGAGLIGLAGAAGFGVLAWREGKITNPESQGPNSNEQVALIEGEVQAPL